MKRGPIAQDAPSANGLRRGCAATPQEDRGAMPGARPKEWGQIEPRQSGGRGWVYSEAMGLDREEIRERIRRYRKLLASNSDTTARKALEELIKEAEALLEDFDERP